MKLAAVFFLLLLAAPAAQADSRQAAREAFNEGTRLYDIADFKSALEAFKRAYLHFEEPSLLFNIAQCYRQLDNKPEAIRFYRTFIRKAQASPQVEESRRFIANMEAQLADDKAKHVEVQKPPPVAVVASPEPRPVASQPVAPAPVISRPAVSNSNSSLVVTATPEKKPVYKKWWFWTVTVVAAAAVATAIGVGVTEGRPRETSFQVHAP